MKQYLDLLRKVKEHGKFKPDRTGTGTFSTIGEQMRFNLADGFPLLTTKKVHLKSIIHELLWFLSGKTDVQYLQDNGVTIWDEWQNTCIDFDDDFTTRRLVHVEPVQYIDNGYYNPDSSGVKVIHGSEDDLLRASWRKMMDRCYNPKAHNYRWYGGRGIFVCERWHKLTNYIEDVKKLANWSKKQKDWNNYNLDKDYYSSNCYDPRVCMWLSKQENGIYGNSSTIIALSPSNEALIYVSIGHCASQMDLAKSSVHRFARNGFSTLKGRNKRLEGWQFGIFDEPFRYEIPHVGDLGPVYGRQWRNWGGGTVTADMVSKLMTESNGNKDAFWIKLMKLFKERENNGIDQIQKVIDTIKNNPDSRRNIVSAWNPKEVDSASLPPCHTLFQFFCEPLTSYEMLDYGTLEERLEYDEFSDSTTERYQRIRAWAKEKGHPTHQLSCQLYCRSQDLFLGTPFNIASYTLLLMMVAQVTNTVAHELIWVGGDCHVYKNHTDQVDEILTREPRQLPTMVLNPLVKDIFDFKYEDFTLMNYNPHPAIKAPVAV